MKEKYQVKGMHCPSCVFALKNSLLELDGVEKAEVDLEEGVADVTFDEKKINVDSFRKVAKELGFEIVN